MTSEQRSYESPEEAALAGWSSSPSAHAQVVTVKIAGDRAEVVIAIHDGHDHADWVYCTRRDGRCHEVLSGNGFSEDWSDPDMLQWD